MGAWWWWWWWRFRLNTMKLHRKSVNSGHSLSPPFPLLPPFLFLYLPPYTIIYLLIYLPFFINLSQSFSLSLFFFLYPSPNSLHFSNGQLISFIIVVSFHLFMYDQKRKKRRKIRERERETFDTCVLINLNFNLHNKLNLRNSSNHHDQWKVGNSVFSLHIFSFSLHIPIYINVWKKKKKNFKTLKNN